MIRFETTTGDAFEHLGAMRPTQEWSQFDVPLDQARQGFASRLVTTIWNSHLAPDGGKRVPKGPAVYRDASDGKLWYRIERPNDSSSRQHKTHFARLELARDMRLSIIGVLKDFATRKCSIDDTFQCSEVRIDIDGEAVWLQLRPARPLDIEFGSVDIGSRTVTQAKELGKHTELAEFALAFAKKVERSSKDTSEERRRRLRHAEKRPVRELVVSYEFVRNPDVVAEVLFRAAGSCERCLTRAPFSRRSDGSPYLEVHHRVRLADGGDDTVENAIALCPNCHRELHYGGSAA